MGTAMGPIRAKVSGDDPRGQFGVGAHDIGGALRLGEPKKCPQN